MPKDLINSLVYRCVHLHLILVWGLFFVSPLKVSGQNNQFLKGIGREASISALIVNLHNGDTLFSHQPHTCLVPASVLKLVTTATILEKAGPQFKYKTEFYLTGATQNSKHNGSLVVLGGADPTLGSSVLGQNSSLSVFTNIANALKSKSITQINGNLIVNNAIFAEVDIPPGRIWEDIGNYYGAIPQGLNYNDNSFALYLSSPNEPNRSCSIVRVVPKLEGVTFKCKVKSSLVNRDSVYIYGVDGLNTWLVNGAMPISQKAFKVKGALPNPAKTFGNALKDFLLTQNITVTGNVVVDNSPFNAQSAQRLLTVQSPSLIEIIKVVNTQSNNLMADNLYLTLALLNNDKASWDNALKSVGVFWNDKIEGAQHLRFYDGSGLSPKNSVSAKWIVDLLTYERKSAYFTDYLGSLAVGGQSGTLKSMWNRPEVAGKVFAKSGSFAGVVAYAGYFKNKLGQWCAFSVIVNNSTAPSSTVRSNIDQLISFYVIN